MQLLPIFITLIGMGGGLASMVIGAAMYNQKISDVMILSGMAVLIVSVVFFIVIIYDNARVFDQQQTTIKSQIKNMNCQQLGNYIINNLDNKTLSDVVSLGQGIFEVKCK